MNEHDLDPAPSDDTVSRIVRLAGPRPPMPEALRREVQQAAEHAWRQKVRRQAARRLRRGFTLAAAAALVLTLGTALVYRLVAPGSGRVVATVTDVFCHAPPWSAGTELGAGDQLEVADCRVALRLIGGQSLRLDHGTRVRLRSRTVIELQGGAIYLDSGSAPSAAALEVRTPYGVARDIGTQFEVRLLEEGLRLQVREGEVQLESAGAPVYRAQAGMAIEVSADGTVHQEETPRHGEAWNWVLLAAPPFELEGATLRAFLDWVARETGWQIRFSDPELELKADSVITHGSVGELSPDQAPGLVLPPAGLDYRVEEGVMKVFKAGG